MKIALRVLFFAMMLGTSSLSLLSGPGSPPQVPVPVPDQPPQLTA